MTLSHADSGPPRRPIRCRGTTSVGEPRPPAHRGAVWEEGYDASAPDPHDVEKARRCLIYRDMVAQTGEVRYDLLDAWPYQPTRAEAIAALLAAPRGSGSYQEKKEKKEKKESAA